MRPRSDRQLLHFEVVALWVYALRRTLRWTITPGTPGLLLPGSEIDRAWLCGTTRAVIFPVWREIPPAGSSLELEPDSGIPLPPAA